MIGSDRSATWLAVLAFVAGVAIALTVSALWPSFVHALLYVPPDDAAQMTVTVEAKGPPHGAPYETRTGTFWETERGWTDASGADVTFSMSALRRLVLTNDTRSLPVHNDTALQRRLGALNHSLRRADTGMDPSRLRKLQLQRRMARAVLREGQIRCYSNDSVYRVYRFEIEYPNGSVVSAASDQPFPDSFNCPRYVVWNVRRGKRSFSEPSVRAADILQGLVS